MGELLFLWYDVKTKGNPAQFIVKDGILLVAWTFEVSGLGKK